MCRPGTDQDPPPRPRCPPSSPSWPFSTPLHCPVARAPHHHHRQRVIHHSALLRGPPDPKFAGARGCWEGADQEGGAPVTPEWGFLGRDRAGEGGLRKLLAQRKESSSESTAVHLGLSQTHCPTALSRSRAGPPHLNPEKDPGIWLKCSLGGLLGPDPGTPTGRASVRGLPAMAGVVAGLTPAVRPCAPGRGRAA